MAVRMLFILTGWSRHLCLRLRLGKLRALAPEVKQTKSEADSRAEPAATGAFTESPQKALSSGLERSDKKISYCTLR